MIIPHKLQRIIQGLVVDGEWQGDWHGDVPVTNYKREWIDVTPYAQHMGIDLHSNTRYTDHGDMEEQDSGRDNEEPGDGVGESQE